MSKKIDTKFFKEKTDEECRELAIHYYKRARKAEAELKLATEEAQAYEELYFKLRESIEELCQKAYL